MGESKITVERGNGEREGYKELKDEARSVQKERKGQWKKEKKSSDEDRKKERGGEVMVGDRSLVRNMGEKAREMLGSEAAWCLILV